jgi:hypothetical protein
VKPFALLSLAALSLAFAPAPFPKATRQGDATDDLKKLQGDWFRVGEDCPVQVRGDVVHFPTNDVSYRITLDTTTTPRRIEFVRRDNPDLIYRGVYRIEGDTWTYRHRLNNHERVWPRDFDFPDPYATLRVNKRKKP